MADGRPPTRRRKTEIVSVRFTPDEVAALHALADGSPVSTYIREKALASLGPRCQDCGTPDARLVGYHAGVVRFSSHPSAMGFSGNGAGAQPEFLWLCRDDCLSRFGVWAA